MSAAGDGPATERLRALLVERGVAPEEVAAAEAERRLGLLVFERALLPSEGRYTAAEAAARSGMPPEEAARLWRALGFPDAAPDERAFTDLDVAALATLAAGLRSGLMQLDVTREMARVVGSSLARVADAEMAASPLFLDAARGDPAAAEALAARIEALLPSLAELLDYVWRRHLLAAARRTAAWRAGGDAPGTVRLTVGFADLVGYTALSQQLGEQALARLVTHFEDLAYDTVAALGGRLVKMIGDEVMFSAGDPAVAARIALALSQAYAHDEMLSDVRVGLAAGTAVAHDGDYFGPVVNRASRIVGIARPGAVVASDEVHAALANDPAFRWRRLRARYLKDLGRVPLWLVRPGAAAPASNPLRTEQEGAGLLATLPEHTRQRAERS